MEKKNNFLFVQGNDVEIEVMIMDVETEGALYLK